MDLIMFARFFSGEKGGPRPPSIEQEMKIQKASNYSSRE